MNSAPQPALTRLKAGTRLNQYEVLGPLGGGGMSVVCRAVDKRLNRIVAIKVLRPEVCADPDRKRRFILEAEAASSLNHPNIITIYEFGTHAGLDYLVMEYLQGKTLGELMGTRPLDLRRCLLYAAQVAGAMGAAHEAGLVHRDLKPYNIMISDRGLVKVLDFGIAKPVTPSPQDSSSTTQTLSAVTQAGRIPGTVPYMSPEQAAGKKVDARSDIFSFGVVLYEMVTGRRAFDGNSDLAILTAILEKEPLSPVEIVPGLPKEIDRLVRCCLRKRPELRWQSMIDLKLVLEDVLRELEGGELGKSRPPSRSWTRYGLGAGIVAAAILAGLWLSPSRRSPQPPEPVVVMLTSDLGLSAWPALSRDGSMVAYASDRGEEGNLDIWVQQIGGGQPIRLTRMPSDESDPDFAPDGTKIAFRSEWEGGGIYTVPTLGGEPQLIAPGGRNPRFSPDGRWIAYWAGIEGSGFLPGDATAMLMPAGGGSSRPLRPDFASGLYPVWSPKGDEVLVLGRSDARGDFDQTLDWWILPVNGGSARKTGVRLKLREQRLSFPAGQNAFLPLAWLEEGNRIVFAASVGDTTNLWEIPLSPQTGLVADAAKRLTSGTGVELQAAFSSQRGQRSRAAYSALSLNIDIWSLPLDAARGVPLGELTKVTRDMSFDACSSLSETGSRLAYVSGGSDRWAIRVKDLPAGREQTLVALSTYRPELKISRDGSQVVYWDGDYRTFRMPAGGGPGEKLCDDCGPPTDVFAGGGKILFEPLEPPEDVMILDAATGRKSSLVAAGGPDNVLYGGRFSPDGRWVAFHASMGQSSRMTVFVAPVDNGKAPSHAAWIPITGGEFAEGDVAWSPDGGMLYFLSNRDGFRCIWARRLDPHTKRPLGNPAGVQHFHHARRSLKPLGDRGGAIGLSVAPDRLVVALGELTGNIWMSESRPPARR